MTAAAAMALAVAVIYAVNTWKIRLVAKGKALASASMEAMQGFLYLYVLVEILNTSNTSAGIGAYVVGAFVGTIVVMLATRRSKGPLVPHHHDCCPPPETPTDSRPARQALDHTPTGLTTETPQHRQTPEKDAPSGTPVRGAHPSRGLRRDSSRTR